MKNKMQDPSSMA